MIECTFEETLREVLENEAGLEGARVETFEERGLLTRDRGLVVRLSSGDEFQLTIVQSRYGEKEGESEDED